MYLKLYINVYIYIYNYYWHCFKYIMHVFLHSGCFSTLVLLIYSTVNRLLIRFLALLIFFLLWGKDLLYFSEDSDYRMKRQEDESIDLFNVQRLRMFYWWLMKLIRFMKLIRNICTRMKSDWKIWFDLKWDFIPRRRFLWFHYFFFLNNSLL